MQTDSERPITRTQSSRTEEALLTPPEVAEILRVSAGWVRNHATRKEPRLRVVKLGKLLRFRRSDIEEFIRQWCQ